ncbi:MAG TPA: hypothetical protein VGS97_01310 [Actinocrinis sp.]|nr:hypothetical protein [Actinocrinis sp.]HEV2342704.1 hypothetical protein [Actinocrinis sp.]
MALRTRSPTRFTLTRHARRLPNSPVIARVTRYAAADGLLLPLPLFAEDPELDESEDEVVDEEEEEEGALSFEPPPELFLPFEAEDDLLSVR